MSKPINEYTMQECLDHLEAMTNRAYCAAYHRGHEDTVDGNYVHVLPVDIDTYFRDDALGFWKPIADRIMELIAVKKRSPAHDERPVYSTTASYQPGDKILG